jgi:drug/metabolite transporter (DMT)-like permease
MTDEPRPLLAAGWMAGAIVSFTAMAVAGREVSVELDTFELMLYRSLIGVLIICAVALATRRTGGIRARRMGLHLVRNVSHFAGQNLWFFAITVAPLAQVIAVEFTSPLWVALLAPLILSERLTPLRAGAAGLGFAGALIVANPSLDAVPPGLLAAAVAAVGFALSAVFTKVLTRTESVISILFWLTVMQAAFGLVTAGIDGTIAVPTEALAPSLATVGVTGLTAHYCLTRALSLAPATIVMPFDFARLPVVAIVGVLLYQEPLSASLVLGGAIILAANWVNLTAEARTRRMAAGVAQR